MHFIVHVLSDVPIDAYRLEKIMEPFFEGNVFRNINEENESYMPCVYPQFRWDYYRVHDEILYHKPEDCFVIIAPDGYCIARKWWDGRKHVDRTREFELFCMENMDKWAGKVYMVEIDCHV